MPCPYGSAIGLPHGARGRKRWASLCPGLDSAPKLRPASPEA